MRKATCMVLTAILVVLGIVFVAPSGADAQPTWSTVSLERLCDKLSSPSVYAYGVKEIKREAAVPLVKELLAVFTAPWRVREQAGPCLDGKMWFENGSSVMEVVTRIADLAKLDQKDVGKTRAELGQILLKDLKTGIAEVRRRYPNDNEGLYTRYILDAVGPGITDWDFTLQQLALIDKELAMLQQHGVLATSARGPQKK